MSSPAILTTLAEPTADGTHFGVCSGCGHSVGEFLPLPLLCRPPKRSGVRRLDAWPPLSSRCYEDFPFVLAFAAGALVTLQIGSNVRLKEAVGAGGDHELVARPRAPRRRHIHRATVLASAGAAGHGSTLGVARRRLRRGVRDRDRRARPPHRRRDARGAGGERPAGVLRLARPLRHDRLRRTPGDARAAAGLRHDAGGLYLIWKF